MKLPIIVAALLLAGAGCQPHESQCRKVTQYYTRTEGWGATTVVLGTDYDKAKEMAGGKVIGQRQWPVCD